MLNRDWMGMIENFVILGIGSLLLGFLLLLYIPKKVGGAGQLAWGSYVLRVTMPFFLIALGIGAIAYSLIG
ncbi:MAG: hypothetical protein ABSG33_10360 [Candidatus Bathyarchaeia archaeon]